MFIKAMRESIAMMVKATGVTTMMRETEVELMPLLSFGVVSGLKSCVDERTAKHTAKSTDTASVMVPGSIGEDGLFLLARE
jgi:hypothetical protein